MTKPKFSVYISGKISGVPDLNRVKFDQAENYLRFRFGNGDNVMIINPHTILHNHDKTWESFMRVDLRYMLKCNIVVVLDDWNKSRGAIIEVLLAGIVAIPVYTLDSVHDTDANLKIGFWGRLKLLFKLLLNRF